MAARPRQEAVRKALHVLLSLAAAAAVWWLPPVEAATVLAGATGVALLVELARRASGPFRHAFQRTLGPLLRDPEVTGLTGATTLSVGYTAVAVLLPGAPALAGILAAGVADAAAAVVGRRFGRTRYPGGKSLEGSAAFFFVALGLALLVPGIGLAAAAGLAIAATLLEAPTLPIHDNLYLPLTTALVARMAGPALGLTFFS